MHLSRLCLELVALFLHETYFAIDGTCSLVNIKFYLMTCDIVTSRTTLPASLSHNFQVLIAKWLLSVRQRRVSSSLIENYNQSTGPVKTVKWMAVVG